MEVSMENQVQAVGIISRCIRSVDFGSTRCLLLEGTEHSIAFTT